MPTGCTCGSAFGKSTIAARNARSAEQRQRVIEARRQAELLDRLHDQACKAWSAASDKEQETLAADLFLAKAVRERR